MTNDYQHSLDYLVNGSQRWQTFKRERDAAYQCYLDASKYPNRALRRMHERAAMRRYTEIEQIMAVMDKNGKASGRLYRDGL